MENPQIKVMITGGTLMTPETSVCWNTSIVQGKLVRKFLCSVSKLFSPGVSCKSLQFRYTMIYINMQMLRYIIWIHNMDTHPCTLSGYYDIQGCMDIQITIEIHIDRHIDTSIRRRLRGSRHRFRPWPRQHRCCRMTSCWGAFPIGELVNTLIELWNVWRGAISEQWIMLLLSH